MITEAFDDKSEAIISPVHFFGEQVKECDIAIATFSREIYPAVLELFPHKEIGQIRAANRIKPIYQIIVNEMKIAFYLSEIGACLAGTDVIEVNWKTGAQKFIFFGSAGGLKKEETTGKYILPTQSYRDEGMSYHYAPPSDYITIRNADKMAKFFAEKDIPYVQGRVWTTDAIYRETREKVAKRKEEGCLAVEMELAGLQAVCDFHGFELYDFLVTGDIVDQPDYSPDGLTQANHSLDKLYIALEIAKRLHENGDL